MIVWLASYPRSGNTLLRQMLKSVFGLTSYSIYDDRDDIGAVSEVKSAVGHEFLPTGWPEFYARTRRSTDIVPVKTHHPPMDDGKAIYIVRDGRASVVSWYNMLRRLRGRTDVELSDVILGRKVAFGSWSQHIAGWRPLERPDTLLLRYEDLAQRPEEPIAAIERFTGAKANNDWHNEFERLHATMPSFFAAADNRKNIAQMSPTETELFWQTHGDAMKAMGYADGEGAPSPA